MANSDQRHSAISKGDTRAEAMMWGYRDAKRGKPYDYDWERRGLGEASAYQNGRMLAIEMRRAGYDLPGWPSPKVFPPVLREMRRLLCESAQNSDEAPSFMFSGEPGTRLRPVHLIDADLRNALMAAGLDGLAPEATIEFY